MVRRRARAAVAKLYGAGGAVLRTQGHRHFCGAPGPRGRHAFKAPGVLPHRAHAHCSEAAGGLGRATGACAAHPAQADGRAAAGRALRRPQLRKERRPAARAAPPRGQGGAPGGTARSVLTSRATRTREGRVHLQLPAWAPG